MLQNFTIQDNKLQIGGVLAEDLIKQYGSPLYVYDTNIIRRQYRTLRQAITYPNTRIFYACKANSNLDVLQTLRAEGCGIEAVSYNEILSTQKAGFQSRDIVYTCSFISREELQRVIETGVMLNIDSLTQLEWFGQIKPGGSVSLRINQGIGAGHHAHTITGGPDSKFGIDISQIEEAQKIAAQYDVKIVGVQQHIGSLILDPEIFIKAIRTLMQTARSFTNLSFIDFGGGFGVPYQESEKPLDMATLGTLITQEVQEFVSSYGDVEIRFEPGRYLVAEAGVLLATVTDIKHTPYHTFVGIDTGFNHLIRPAMYDSYHQIVNTSRVSGQTQKVWIAGNICESGDIFARDRELTECAIGDTVAILGAGAYGRAMSFVYNGREQPSEVVVADGTAHLTGGQ